LEEPVKIPEGDQKKGVYIEDAIWFCTLFGGPIAAGFMFAENFRILNMPARRKRTWWIILPEAFLFAFFSIRFNIELGILYSLNTIVTFFIFHLLIGKEVDEYLMAGGRVISRWLSFLVIVEGILGSALIYFITEYLYVNMQGWFFNGKF
jgi:hypothetical protein